MIRVLLVDNHDSFTYNLVQLVRETPLSECTVVPHNSIRVEEVAQFDKIIFSPGPGLPREFPAMFGILDAYGTSKAILGVCLGHQAIAEHFGGSLINLSSPLHGIREKLSVDSPTGVLAGIGSDAYVGLYHSWAVDPSTLPGCFTVTSRTRTELIMSLRHRDLDVQSVQFHPESYMTSHGQQMMENWLLN